MLSASAVTRTRAGWVICKRLWWYLHTVNRSLSVGLAVGDDYEKAQNILKKSNASIYF